LANKKIGLFLSCMFGGDDAQRQLHDAFGPELLQRAAAVELIGGGVNAQKLNFGEKIITKLVSKVKKEAAPVELDAVLQRLAHKLRQS
jgi:menaquinone-dependent protoporphyrinogen oxidase